MMKVSAPWGYSSNILAHEKPRIEICLSVSKLKDMLRTARLIGIPGTEKGEASTQTFLFHGTQPGVSVKQMN